MVVSREDLLPDYLHIPERAFRVASTRGVDVAVIDWGTPETDHLPVLLLSHATGLHGHCWVPMVRALAGRFRCVALDQRAQGDSNRPTVGTLSWDGIADDVEITMGALDLFGRDDVYGVGHSQGGFAVLEVERRRPGTFRGLFLYEPVIFPSMGGNGPGPDRKEQDNFMATAARKRRPVFDSWAAAAANFAVKGPFAQGDPDLVSSYVYWGFDEQPDGTVRLKCTPDDEADLFLNSFTDLWESTEQITTPTTVAVAEHTAPVFATHGPILAKRLRKGQELALPGRSHFGMFERIPEMADIIHRELTNH
jgi:pimeloyl-ACP methyl ester carboxylesterase